jgi:hypothetical protein
VEFLIGLAFATALENSAWREAVFVGYPENDGQVQQIVLLDGLSAERGPVKGQILTER